MTSAPIHQTSAIGNFAPAVQTQLTRPHSAAETALGAPDSAVIGVIIPTALVALGLGALVLLLAAIVSRRKLRHARPRRRLHSLRVMNP